MLATKWTLRRFEKGEQHGVLALGQGDWGAGWVSELPGSAVKLPPRKSKAATLGVACRCGSTHVEPPQDSADAREQLTQIEWLCQIIICAELETNHPIDVVPAVTSND